MTKEAPAVTVNLDDAGGSSRDISNDVITLDWATPRGIQDSTGVDKSAMERLLLLADFTCTMTGIFNSAANQSHDVLSPAGTNKNARTCSIVTSGQTLTAQEVFVTDYSLQRQPTGELTWTSPLVLKDGIAPSWS